MKTKMLVILFALIAVSAKAQVTGTPVQQNTSIIPPPTYSTWCVSNLSAPLETVRWELRRVCDYGADCRPVFPGGPCDLEYVTSRASYAFNDYYQRDPINRKCHFKGAAMLTIKDPSTPTCRFPSNSTSTLPLPLDFSSVTRTAVPNLGSFLWGLGFTYLAYVAAQIA